MIIVGGIEEKAMFSYSLSQKETYLNKLYEEVLEAIRKYEIREGYEEIDEHKQRLEKVKIEVEDLLTKINDTAIRLKG